MHDSGLETRLATLAGMPTELASRAHAFAAGDRYRRSAAGGFSLIEHAWHLADLEERAFAVRIRRLSAEVDPALADFDGAAVAIAGRYQEQTLEPALAAFAAARARNLELLRALGPAEWSRRGSQEGVGALSLADLPRLMAEHDAAHREELAALRAEQLCEALSSAPARVKALLGEFDEPSLRRPPDTTPVDAEALSAIGHACHLRDIEIEGYHVRIRRTLGESNPRLASLDSDRLAHERAYASADPAAALGAFAIARGETVATLRGVLPAQWSRPADFDSYGEVTLLGLIEILAGHDRAHLAALRAMPTR